MKRVIYKPRNSLRADSAALPERFYKFTGAVPSHITILLPTTEKHAPAEHFHGNPGHIPASFKLRSANPGHTLTYIRVEFVLVNKEEAEAVFSEVASSPAVIQQFTKAVQVWARKSGFHVKHVSVEPNGFLGEVELRVVIL